MLVFINLKKMGKLRNSIEKVPFQLGENIATVRELITETVKICVADYNSRKENSELLTNLSKSEISDKAVSGKISFGINYGEKPADTDKAIDNALQCFEDGIFRIFLNNVSLENIDDKVEIKENDQLTFVRLTMLAGRMW